MNIDEKLNLPFPFLDALGKQAFRQDKCNGNLYTYQIQTGLRRFPPFEIVTTACSGTACSGDTWELYDTSDNFISDLEADYSICDFMDFDIDDFTLWIQYDGAADFAINLPAGQYYIKVDLGGCVFYSEIVTICDIPLAVNVVTYAIDRLTLTYGNTCDLDNIYYTEWFLNRIIFQDKIDLTKPEYEVEKVATPLDGYLQIEKVTTKKKYKFTFYAPEFMADAMNLLSSHNRIYVTDKFGDTAVVKEANVTITAPSHCFFKIIVDLYIDPANSTNCCA